MRRTMWKKLHPIDEIAERSESLQMIRDGICEGIPCMPDTPEVRELLRAMSFNELFITYMNWVDRTVRPRPRQVLAWDGFYRTPAIRDVAADVDEIIKKSIAGEDLKPYLSTQIDKFGFAPRDTKKRGVNWGDKDRALNAYGMHHLHLKPVKRSGRRKGESRKLLYAKFSRREMLLVMLGDHASFDDGTLFQAASDMLSDNNEHIRGITGIANERTSQESANLLKYGINTPSVSGDRITAPTMITSSGASASHVRHADLITTQIEEIEDRISEPSGREWLREQLGTDVAIDADWGWSLHYADLYLVDGKSKRGWLIAPWTR